MTSRFQDEEAAVGRRRWRWSARGQRGRERGTWAGRLRAAGGSRAASATVLRRGRRVSSRRALFNLLPRTSSTRAARDGSQHGKRAEVELGPPRGPRLRLGAPVAVRHGAQAGLETAATGAPAHATAPEVVFQPAFDRFKVAVGVTFAGELCGLRFRVDSDRRGTGVALSRTFVAGKLAADLRGRTSKSATTIVAPTCQAALLRRGTAARRTGTAASGLGAGAHSGGTDLLSQVSPDTRL